MKTQIEDIGLKDIFRLTSLPGWLLLIQPVLYIVLARKRDLNAYASVDTTAVVFIFYSFICFIVACRTVLMNYSDLLGKDVLSKSPLVWLLVYTLLGAISSLWSVVPTLTAFRSFECFATILLICACIQKLFETGDKRFVILWTLFYAVWESSWAIIKTIRWTTDLGIILEASQFTATTFFFVALYFTPRRWYNYLIIAMSVFSMSTVAYMGMALGLISSFWLNTKAKALATAAAFILVFASLIIGPYTLVKNTIFFDKEEISLENTTGRDHLMEAAIDCIYHYPMGLGFFAAEPYVLYAKHLGGISAHNSFFSAGMGLGYPGILLIGTFFIAMGFAVFSKYIDKRVKPILIGCCCVAFMHCMGNPSIGSRVYAAWLPGAYIFILTCFFYVYGRFYDEEDEEDEVFEYEIEND